MANTIPSEYTSFKDKLDGKVDSMSSKCQEIKNSLNQISNSETKAISGLNQYYKSDNKANIMACLSDLSTLVNIVSSSLDSPLNQMIIKCNSIVTDVKRLEAINTEIDENEREIATENRKEEPNQSTISSCRSKITSLNTEFKNLCDKVGADITAVKGMDTTIDISSVVGTVVSAGELAPELRSKLQYGQFYRKKFTYKGVTIEYLVYVPDYGQKVDKLPINMYMHGSGTGENSFSRLQGDALGKFITDKQYKPSGIIVLPLAPSGNSYENKAFRDALAQLPFQVARDYNGDEKRVSLSGHSWGAITAYRLVNENPGKFTAIVTASGSVAIDKLDKSAFKDIKILAFHGTNDLREGSNTNYNQAVKTLNSLRANGTYVYWHPYKGANHGGSVISDTFTGKFEIDGQVINPIEYAFQQTRA